MKMGPVDQMHLNPYNNMQDLVDVYNVQPEMLQAHAPGHARTNQPSQPGQPGGPAARMEGDDPEIQNMELQQVLAETQHVILKQLNQINSHSRHLFPQGLPANKEDGGDARAQPDMPDPKATAERRKEGYLQRAPSQQPISRQPSTSPTHAARQHPEVLAQEHREIQRNITQLFAWMGQQQSLYQTLLAQRMAQTDQASRQPAQAPAGHRVDAAHSGQHAERRQRAPSQVLADRDARPPAPQHSADRNHPRNFDELFEPRQQLRASRNSSRLARPSQGSGPSQFGRHNNSK